MSLELYIFMLDSQVPSRDAWQQTMDELGFPTVLDPSFDLRHDKGFSPTTYNGQMTGFEFYLEPAADILSTYSHIASKVGSRDTCATFRWGADMAECAASLSAASSLTKLTDGIYFYPDDDIIYSADEAVEATRRDLSSI
ncbi:MAG: hypothetical protein ACKVRN_04430 [Pyrinomonadaceae bacterium]